MPASASHSSSPFPPASDEADDACGAPSSRLVGAVGPRRIRRAFLAGAAALVPASLTAFPAVRALAADARAGGGGAPLPIPPVIEAGPGTPAAFDAIAGMHRFVPGATTPTLGFAQAFLGPTIRVRRGTTAPIAITNRTPGEITAHWHGLHVEGVVDGGPHSAFAPGRTWSASLDIDQPAATLWYHSHVHGRTAEQVYAGLAGMLIVDDPGAPPDGLPKTWGVDDIPLIVQDRAFDAAARLVYFARGPSMMRGFRAGEIVVNGAVRPVADVPAGWVRLRVLNGSNARIYRFGFEDGRRFHQVASDGGLLARPVPMTELTLGPAERAEILVDFSDGRAARLLSADDDNGPAGMMGGGMMGGRRMGGGPMGGGAMGGAGEPGERSDDGRFEVMRFSIDRRRAAAVGHLPERFAGAPAKPVWDEPVRDRLFRLDMHVGGMGGGRGMGSMGINGRSMAMDRVDFEARVGETERWRVVANEMAHPFHVHGTQFVVLSDNGRPVPFDSTGMKDVYRVHGEAELLVRFARRAPRHAPYMFHCHILEHEDAGMMGQFTVA